MSKSNTWCYQFTLLLLLLTPLTTKAAEVQPRLVREIEAALKHPAFDRKKTAVVIARPQDQTPLVAIHPDLKMNPASCVKVITAAAALTELGTDYRFQTRFLSDRPPQNGVIGALYVRGDGDPFLVSEELWRMLLRMRDHHITKVGDIVIDNSFFDGNGYPRQGGKSLRAYAAETSAVALNFNSVTIRVQPGEKGKAALVILDPPNDYTVVENRVTTGKKMNLTIDHHSTQGREQFIVKGSIPFGSQQKVLYRRVEHPAPYAGAVIKMLLKQHGIAVTGKIRQGVSPATAHHLFTERSKPLGLIVRDMNKFSNNFTAEQILKHLGAVRSGKPGTTEKGLEVLHTYLTSIGIARKSYTIENGSGFSNTTRLSAGQLVQVLNAAYHHFPIRHDFIASFSLLGVDGTMKAWPHQKSFTGQVRGKTGTLSSVSSVVGYIPLEGGEIASFAILSNGFRKGIGETREAQIQLLSKVVKP